MNHTVALNLSIIIASCASLFALFHLCVYLCAKFSKKGKRMHLDKWKVNRHLWGAVCGIIIGAIFFVETYLINAQQRAVSTATEENPLSEFLADESVAAEFGELRQNEEYTKWERLLREELGFGEYEKGKKCIYYHKANRKALKDEYPSLDDIDRIFEEYSEYIPELTYTQDEIISSYAGKSEVGIDIHKQEVVFYRQETTKNPTRGNAYQAGRAAQDVVDGLCKDENANIKEIILYAALAVDYYLLSMHLPDSALPEDNVSDKYTVYRIGMVYSTLAQCEDLTRDDSQYTEYYEFFLLKAEGFYHLVLESAEVLEADTESDPDAEQVEDIGLDELLQEKVYHVKYYRGQEAYRLSEYLAHSEAKEVAQKYIREYLDEMEYIPEAYRLPNAEKDCENMWNGLKE